jgi:type IV pilus assembly protein PilM
MANTIVGVDIAGTAVRAVEVADADGERPTLLRYGEAPLPRGAVHRGEVVGTKAVTEALRKLWSEVKFKTKNVVLGVGNATVIVREATVPHAPLERIRESLPFQVQDLLPMPVSDAILDYYPIEEVTTEDGRDVRGLLVAAVKESVTGNVKAAEAAGLAPRGVDLVPFALCRTLAPHAARPDRVAIVDMGAHTTTVVIAEDSVPRFVRIVPTGGADITEAIASRCRLDLDAAEDHKRRLGLGIVTPDAGMSAADRAILGVMRELTDEVLASLRNTIRYYDNTHGGRVEQIRLTGGGARLGGLASALGSLARIPVEPADPFGVVGTPKAIDLDDLQPRKSNLSVALSLAVGSAR